MVRFSDFITLDRVHGPKMPASHNEPNANAAPLAEADIEKVLSAKELKEDAGTLKDQGPSCHIDDKSPGQGPADEITDQENAYRQLAEISSRKRSLLPGSFWAVVVVVAIALIALRLTGVLPLKKEQGPGPIALRETGPAFKREKISQPAEALTPAPAPVQEEIPKPDSQPTIEEDIQTKTMEQTVPEVKPPEVASVPEPTRQKAEVNPVLTATEHYPYSLHMGSVKTKRQADRSIAELKKKGLSPYWIFVSLPDKGKWYRVFVGYFRTKAEADAFQKAHGIRADRILKTAYAVRIGSFTSKEELDQKISSLKAADYCPYIIEKQGRYDLLVGVYQTRQAAEQLAVRLKAIGFDCEMTLR